MGIKNPKKPNSSAERIKFEKKKKFAKEKNTDVFAKLKLSSSWLAQIELEFDLEASYYNHLSRRNAVASNDITITMWHLSQQFHVRFWLCKKQSMLIQFIQ